MLKKIFHKILILLLIIITVFAISGSIFIIFVRCGMINIDNIMYEEYDMSIENYGDYCYLILCMKHRINKNANIYYSANIKNYQELYANTVFISILLSGYNQKLNHEDIIKMFCAQFGSDFLEYYLLNNQDSLIEVMKNKNM